MTESPRPQRAADAPEFDEPWQAQIHAIAQILIEGQQIEPARWSEILGAAIRSRLAGGERDDLQTYYAAMTDAVVTVTGLSAGELGAWVDQWQHAYESTPHGQPVSVEPPQGSPGGDQ